MCWLAIAGELEAEFAKHGIVDPNPVATHAATSSARPWFGSLAWGHALTMASAVGVIVALMDLYDLIEPMEVLHFPAIQLGVPLVAFTAALLASCRALFAARRIPAATPTGGYVALLPPRSEASLQRACLVLLMFGAVAFGLAELMEHGLLQSPHIFAGIVARGYPVG
jgi:hypothetical protein